MANTVHRDFSVPDLWKTGISREIDPCGRVRSGPFTQKEISKRRRGYYSGEYVPGWRRRRANGELLPKTTYTRYDEYMVGSGWRHITWYTQLHDGHNCTHESHTQIAWILEGSNSTAFDIEKYCWDAIHEMDKDADGLLQEAAADVSESFDALTFVAEIGQIRSMFFRTGGNILSHLLRRPHKAAAAAWLEWQFGWRQLWNDVLAITKAIALLSKPASRVRKNKRDSSTETVDRSLTVQRGNGDLNHYKVLDTVETKICASVIAQIDNNIGRIQVNPFATAWEIIPYSFVVDYFFNIGAWIQSTTLLTFGTPYTASVGFDVSFKRVIELTPAGIGSPASMEKYDCGGYGTVEAHLRHRSPRAVKIESPPRLNLGPVSTTRIINLISCALQKSPG